MNSISDSPISNIVIAGSGLEAWMTACTLLNQLGRKNIKVTICPVDGSDTLDDLYSVLPCFDNDVLPLIGLNNVDLVNECDTSFSLGCRYTGLSTTDPDQFKPYGDIGMDFLGGAFYQHWLRDTRSGGQTPTASGYFSYTPASHAAGKNAFAPPVKRNAIGSLQHQMARHVDVRLLTALLRKRALTRGATELTGTFESAERSSTSMHIKQLVTSTGETLQADLYVDCSGNRRSLIGGAGEEWVSAPLSVEYQVRFNHETDNPTPTPFNLVSALPSGWQVTIPGCNWQVTMDLLEQTPTSTGPVFKPGYISRPWSENCVALGIAAMETLPVDALQAKYLMITLKRLVKLLPGSDCATSETTEFNQLCLQDSQEVAELSALYEAARQHGGLDPDSLEDLQIPATLSKRVALFAKRGWVAPLDTDIIRRSDWSAAFISMGLFPAQHDRIVERLPADQLTQALRDLKARIEKVAAEFPPHGKYLDAIKASSVTKA